jgi:hypothetical protein
MLIGLLKKNQIICIKTRRKRKSYDIGPFENSLALPSPCVFFLMIEN